MTTLAPEKLFGKTATDVVSSVAHTPNWMLGGLLGAGAGAVVGEDDRLGNAVKGGLIGAGIGLGVDAVPDVISKLFPSGSPSTQAAPAIAKVGFITPSISLPGGLGIRSQRGDRLPGTSMYVDPDVVERAGRALDKGQGVEGAIHAGAQGSQTNYLPIAGTVLGGLLGNRLGGGAPSTTIGALLGGAGGLYMQRRTLPDAETRAREAVKGLLIERARLGDAEAVNLLQSHYSEQP